MKYIFNQFRGLGDIIFIMQIAQEEVAKGNRVLFPVESHYLEIAKHFPGVEFIDKKDLKINYENRSFVWEKINDEIFDVIPFRFANDILQVPYTDCMKAKYWYFDKSKGLYKESWTRWRNFTIKRDHEAEERLLKLVNPSGEPFNLINRNFRTNFSGKSDIKFKSENINIEMRAIKGFTMIDWSRVLEEAQVIHTVGTSINYLIEKLNIKVPIHLYKRLPEERDFKNYDYILDQENKKYIFH